MDFHTYFAELSAEQRRALAMKANTSLGQLRHLAAGRKRIELGFADAIVALCENKVTLSDLPLTDNARHQRLTREGKGREAAKLRAAMESA